MGPPGGSEPQPTIHLAPGAAVAAAIIASTSSDASSGPGSFSFVSVPSASTTLTFVLIEPAIGTAEIGVASARSRRYVVAEASASGSTPTVGTPCAPGAHQTFTPFPAPSPVGPLAR